MKKIKSEIIDLCGEWYFHYGEIKPFSDGFTNKLCLEMTKAGAMLGSEEEFENNNWEKVNIPHDFCTDLPHNKSLNSFGGFKPRGISWYKKEFTSPKSYYKILLEFDGIMGDAQIFVNGTLAGRSYSGYTSNFYDISSLVLEGKNQIAVKVNAYMPEGWWYEGAGIYRKARIILLPDNHIKHNSIFITPRKFNNEWFADICMDFHNTDTCDLSITFTDKHNKTIAEHTEIIKSNTEKYKNSIRLINPPLWSPEAPNLIKCNITFGNECSEDIKTLNIGVRSLEFINNKGMYLNGKHINIKGICCHQDHSGLGVAVPELVNEYRIKKLKELGCNAYRCAHNSPDESILNLCDKYGMLVMVENRHFDTSDDTLKQIESMVLSARNHPSVFIYSLFNEEPIAAEITGKRIFTLLKEHLLKFDNTRMITGALHLPHAALNNENAGDEMDIIGINYNLDDFAPTHKKYPDKLILATENCPTYATRGIYKSDEKSQIFASCGTSAFGENNSIVETMNALKDKPYCIGCFAWSGYDYRGEPAPYGYPSVRSHWGFQDSCGFVKDSAYQLKSYYAEQPVLHIFPFEDKLIAFTNLAEISLYKNGEFIKTVETKDCKCEWELDTNALNEQDIITAKCDGFTVEYRPRLSANKIETLIHKNSTIAIVDIMATDKNGNIAVKYNEDIKLTPINCEIMGVGNGNPNGVFDDKSNLLPCFNGCAQVILKLYENAQLKIDTTVGFSKINI